MAYLILTIFLITCLCAFFEKRFTNKTNMTIFCFIGLLLFIMAGMREVGIDPDSENYENSYQQYYNLNILDGIEYSFILLSSILNIFTDDVHALFLVYAFMGVFMKMIAFRQLSEFYFLPLIIYISFYYELHELTQIRTGVLSALMLLMIRPLSEGKKTKVFILICIGVFFHYSAFICLPFLFLSNNPLNMKWKIILFSAIPIAYIIYFIGGSFIMNAELPLIGNKLALYQAAEESGKSDIGINVFGAYHIFSTFLCLYLLLFSDTITEHNKYFPLLIKIFVAGICAYTAFAFLPVLSQRISYLLRIVSVILLTNIYYTIKPRWAGIIVVILVAVITMNYGLQYINFDLLWKVD